MNSRQGGNLSRIQRQGIAMSYVGVHSQYPSSDSTPCLTSVHVMSIRLRIVPCERHTDHAQSLLGKAIRC